MNSIFEAANELKEELVEIRRTIHQCPEVGPILPKTKEFVMNKLKELGYEPEEICESGIVATIEGGKPGKTFLLRADMDALAIKEEAPVSFASKNNSMHACGHDMHTTMLLGAAKLLKEHQDEIAGKIKLVFQPDEEGFTGAKTMLNAGVKSKSRCGNGTSCQFRHPVRNGSLRSWNLHGRMHAVSHSGKGQRLSRCHAGKRC